MAVLQSLLKFVKSPLGWLTIGLVVLVVGYLAWTGAVEGFASDSDIGSGKTLVLFHLPKCPHCVDFMPEWNKVEEKHKNDPNVTIKKINGEEHPEKAQEHGVDGFPTVLLFKNGKKVATFDGDRTEAGVEKFLSRET